MSLKYLLMILLVSLSIGCLGMLAFETQWSRIIVIICLVCRVVFGDAFRLLRGLAFMDGSIWEQLADCL
ncbi:MAG: hypothetical protein CM1200mP16_08220 [Nitrospina sp.]|nr:MAG: hypothetical protein CM1200mP16_08220 [Nitrospina sp.]